MSDTDLVWFVFSPHCFDVFTKMDVENFINDGCAATVISKLLGYAIICGSFALKIPQIIKIVSAKSAAGLSVLSIVIESLAFLVTTAYFYRQGYAASTYGESPIIFIQNMIILLLVFSYTKDSSFIMGLLLVIAYSGLFAVSLTEFVPLFVVQKLFASNLLMVLGSRLPQIYTIYKAGSTGNNAFITWFLNFGGTLARLFTTLQEVNDVMALVVICTSMVCNGTIVLQFAMYWNSDKKKKD
eukprot:1023966_1